MTKLCSKCGQPGEFYKNKSKCKSCIREERKAKRHPDITAEKRREYRFNHALSKSKKEFPSKDDLTTGKIIHFLVRNYRSGPRKDEITKAAVENVRNVLVKRN